MGKETNTEEKDFSAPSVVFWHSEVQMGLLTHCFNTIVFYQLLTVGDGGGKGQVTRPAETLHFLSPARSTGGVYVCVWAWTSWYLSSGVQAVESQSWSGVMIVNANKCWWNKDGIYFQCLVCSLLLCALSGLSVVYIILRKGIWAHCCLEFWSRFYLYVVPLPNSTTANNNKHSYLSIVNTVTVFTKHQNRYLS